ncbi:MAG TPA: squalene/phytoene synthase family protein, partial [Caulifigura sp.]|nr:squalene/phytoene synthase family protein [Caulifigura sp.]
SDEDLQARRTTPEFLALMKFEVDRAREFLLAGQPLLKSVQGRRLRLDLNLFLAGGLKILDEIESIGYRVWDRRPTVTKAARVGLLVKAIARSFW